jgi:phosphate transport system protein
MSTHFEQSVERDLGRLRSELLEMAGLAARALGTSVRALVEGNRQLAYAVILRDRYIDEKEKEIDRLCLEFLIRQQPAGGLLRLAYGTIKVNLELERVGDYAESVARHVLRLNQTLPEAVTQRIVEMADLAIPMVHDSINAFIRQDADLARKTIEVEPAVDALQSKLNADLIELLRSHTIPPEMMDPLLTIGRRFERVADQARNVCMEALYLRTGEYAKHPGSDAFRILFVGEHNACRSQMAEAIGDSLNQPNFIFSSAGLDPAPIDGTTLRFMQEKGFDLSRMAPKAIHQVPDLDQYQVVVGVARQSRRAFPQSPRKMVYVDWSIDDPSRAQGSPEEIRAAYETTYQFLASHVRDLVEAVLGSKID